MDRKIKREMCDKIIGQKEYLTEFQVKRIKKLLKEKKTVSAIKYLKNCLGKTSFYEDHLFKNKTKALQDMGVKLK